VGRAGPRLDRHQSAAGDERSARPARPPGEGARQARLRCAIAFLIGDRHLRLARAYGERFPDEMAAFIEDTRRPLDELRRLYPFLQAGE
jgi:hypothetical protein